ncbi:hypothetical protein ACFE04_023230 [Oxalis oulophora]
MEISSHQEGDIPIPLNSSFVGVPSYGHGHMIHHHHHQHNDHAPPNNNHNIISTSSETRPPSTQIPNNNNNNNNNNNGPTAITSLPSGIVHHDHDHDIKSATPYKKMVKYRECLKNHAASMGGSATDGCGEFMPSGEEGSIEALTCSACNCHRNFHRKEVEGDPLDHFYSTSSGPSYFNGGRVGRKVNILGGHHKNLISPHEALGFSSAPGAILPSRAVAAPHQQMIMSYNMGSLPSESDEQEDGIAGNGGGMMARGPQHHHHNHHLAKKRFRTKFTQEQKEKMLNFAEKVGWKFQKQEETVVQQFCQELGIKRRVLKVWMHNNKHSLAKKNTASSPAA